MTHYYSQEIKAKFERWYRALGDKAPSISIPAMTELFNSAYPDQKSVSKEAVRYWVRHLDAGGTLATLRGSRGENAQAKLEALRQELNLPTPPVCGASHDIGDGIMLIEGPEQPQVPTTPVDTVQSTAPTPLYRGLEVKLGQLSFCIKNADDVSMFCQVAGALGVRYV